MTTPQPTERDVASVIVACPGNGTRYQIVFGRNFVALPDFQRANTMTPWPADWRYIAEKLDLREPDARAVFEALAAEARTTTEENAR